MGETTDKLICNGETCYRCSYRHLDSIRAVWNRYVRHRRKGIRNWTCHTRVTHLRLREQATAIFLEPSRSAGVHQGRYFVGTKIMTSPLKHLLGRGHIPQNNNESTIQQTRILTTEDRLYHISRNNRPTYQKNTTRTVFMRTGNATYATSWRLSCNVVQTVSYCHIAFHEPVLDIPMFSVHFHH